METKDIINEFKEILASEKDLTSEDVWTEAEKIQWLTNRLNELTAKHEAEKEKAVEAEMERIVETLKIEKAGFYNEKYELEEEFTNGYNTAMNKAIHIIHPTPEPHMPAVTDKNIHVTIGGNISAGNSPTKTDKTTEV